MPQGRVSGAERVLFELLAQSPSGTITVLAPLGSEVAAQCQALGHAVRHFHVPKLREAGPRYPYAMSAAFVRLWRVVRDERIEVIHSFLTLTAKVAGPVSRAAGVPLVQSVHDVISSTEIGAARNLLYRLQGRLFPPARTIAVSDFIRESLIAAGHPAEGIVVIHNGVAAASGSAKPPTRASLGIPRDAQVFLQLGRITPWKGHRTSLDAFEMLVRGDPGNAAHLLIVGRAFDSADAKYEAELRARADASAVRDRIVFAGHTDTPGDYYELADVVLVPSERPDPFPTVVLEAGLAGRPVIVSRLGGGREAILDQSTGLVIEPTPAALEAAMRQALDASWALAAGIAARRHISAHFSPARYAEAVHAVWREVAAG
jgi:glycosyltransferase involved in cell wall biosynthesis